MTDGDKGIPGKVSPRHLKPAAAGGGWVTATDQEKEGSSSERRKKKGLTRRRRQPKLGVWGAVKRHMGANCVCTRNSPGWGGLEPNSGPSWLHPQSSSPSSFYREAAIASRALNGDETL